MVWNICTPIPPKKIKLDVYVTIYITTNSKWIIEWHVECKTVKLWEENTGGKILQIFFGKSFSYVIPKTWPNKEYFGKMKFIQIESLTLQKTTLRCEKTNTCHQPNIYRTLKNQQLETKQPYKYWTKKLKNRLQKIDRWQITTWKCDLHQ